MEPESLRVTETAVPGQPEGSPDPRPGVSEVVIPAPRPVEPGPPRPAGLSARDRALLDFEKRPWPSTGAKEQAIRERFDLSASRYFQDLNALLDRPEALAADPVLVNRLRRLRTARRQARSSPGGDAV